MQKEAVTYDFRRPNKFNRDHIRALQIANETFARQLTTVLATTVRAVSQVSLRGVGQQTYDEHIQAIPNPSYLAIVAMRPLSGGSLFHIPLNLVYASVDRLLGGPGVGAQPKRAVTEIEGAVFRNLLNRALKELAYAFESLTQIQPEVVYQESNPQFAQVAAPSDMVITSSYDIRIGAAHGIATLCIPFNSLQPVLDDLTNNALEVQSLIDPLTVRANLENRLDATPVPVSVAFDPITLTSAEVVAMRPGDLVPLHHPVETPLAIKVGDVECFAGKAGKRGTRLACQVLDSERRTS